MLPIPGRRHLYRPQHPDIPSDRTNPAYRRKYLPRSRQFLPASRRTQITHVPSRPNAWNRLVPESVNLGSPGRAGTGSAAPPFGGAEVPVPVLGPVDLRLVLAPRVRDRHRRSARGGALEPVPGDLSDRVDQLGESGPCRDWLRSPAFWRGGGACPDLGTRRSESGTGI